MNETVIAAQLLPNDSQQLIGRGVPEIARSHLRRIAAPARTANRQHRPAAAFRLRDEQALHAHAVDRIDDKIEWTRQQLIRRSLRKELDDWRNAARGIDGGDALRQHRGFGPADLSIHGGKLPVDVGDAHVVEVNQGERPDPTARQPLDGPRSDAAETHDAHMSRRDARQAFATEQPTHATKAVEIIG
jgi:hypothetical protein